MTTTKKLILSDVQKDVKKRMRDFDAQLEKLNAMRNGVIAKPKSKNIFSAFLGL